MSRKLLGRFEIDEQVEQSIAETGMLDLFFDEARGDVTVVSHDGNRTIAWLSPSGAIAGLLVQDYVNGESRTVPFEFGHLEIEDDDERVSVYLVR